MQKIQLNDETLSILRESIDFQKRLLLIKIQKYLQRLKIFEKKYSMKSSKSFRDFENGKLGDAPEWYDWFFVYETYNKANQKKQTLEGLSL